MYEITNTNYQPMQELIKITEKNGNKAVSARELHKFLEITERFSNWFERMLQYGFVENHDFTSVKSFTLVNNGAQRELEDYALTLDCAKEISMLQRSERGKMARQYFIECEKQLRAKEQAHQQIPQSFSEALRLAAEQAERIEAQQKQLQAQAPKVLFADTVIGSQSSCLIGELAKLITQKGYEIGEKRLFKWLRENHYLGTRGEYYNIPNQQYIEQGLFELKKGTRSGSGGVMHTTITPKVTGKGQVYFVNKFLKTI
ncbi:phage antirepressor protein [Capnocytophaga ochracea DSM 7271]|uniref:Phage antirepressor protein n=1 Tax=Capnocytophaga ochracea (strain ATCC 27872 / DSM 7271 / CCUG 9716 / JCM 12966 / NCTC 12371 / SS31 / VPI 2845) TaxID=521097 RepID=C7M988_CAPOD|nr:phage antirepressor Ant [Capnocytophaga ochracea]ACU92434.1 phage antirepressor protein [Capnocytophaga ochracea DSM 7271]